LSSILNLLIIEPKLFYPAKNQWKINLKKILIIEDEKNLRKSICDLLQQDGYSCIQAQDGEKGIDISINELPDLIICDIKMPGINGHQVFQELRNNIRTSEIPFIFLSALVDKKNLREGMLLGADDYITKPFQPDELLSAIEVRLKKYEAIKDKIESLRESISYALPHEFKTPLVAILGYSEILIDKFRDSPDEEAKEFSQAIYNAGLRLNRLIQQFIIYKKLSLIDEKDNISELTPLFDLDVQLIIKQAENIAQNYQRKNDLTVEVTDGKVKLPANFFSTIIEELLDNSFKFSEPGTEVLLRGNQKENNYFITVLDEGRGLSEEQIAKIGAYQQFDRTKYEQQGVGLGLAIVKRITYLYGGEIKIISKKNKGTKIEIILPSS